MVDIFKEESFHVAIHVKGVEFFIVFFWWFFFLRKTRHPIFELFELFLVRKTTCFYYYFSIQTFHLEFMSARLKVFDYKFWLKQQKLTAKIVQRLVILNLFQLDFNHRRTIRTHNTQRDTCAFALKQSI